MCRSLYWSVGVGGCIGVSKSIREVCVGVYRCVDVRMCSIFVVVCV